MRRSLIGVLLAAMLALVLPAAPASAYTSLSNGNHKDRRAVDTDRPIWYGWDSTKGGYHIAVNGRWVAACGGNYCYAPEGPYVWDGHSYRLGAVDKVGLEFAHALGPAGEAYDTITQPIVVRAKPAVLVHGLNSNAATWASYAAFLQAANRTGTECWGGPQVFAKGTVQSSPP